MKNKTVIRHVVRFALPLALLAHGVAVRAGEEVSLFNNRGAPVAYIDIGAGLTIYMWSGEPVAYLEKGSYGNGYDVYGFNGKHLGWFTKGAIWDHEGGAACATAEVMTSGTQGEPGKAGKQGQPGKAGAKARPASQV